MRRKPRGWVSPDDDWNQEYEERDPKNVADALEQIERTLEQIEDLPDEKYLAGADFFESVKEKLESMAQTIEKSKRVTERQTQAIERMSAGVAKWVK